MTLNEERQLNSMLRQQRKLLLRRARRRKQWLCEPTSGPRQSRSAKRYRRWKDKRDLGKLGAASEGKVIMKDGQPVA